MKIRIITTFCFLLAATFTFIPSVASAQYVSNQSHCLSLDTSSIVGDMIAMENRCSYEVSVSFCYGIVNCDTRPGATTVPARGKRTVYKQHRKYPHRQLIAFACRDDVDFVDCQNAKEEFFRTRFRE